MEIVHELKTFYQVRCPCLHTEVIKVGITLDLFLSTTLKNERTIKKIASSLNFDLGLIPSTRITKNYSTILLPSFALE